MPLSTFDNLDTEKQEIIIQTALKEFATHPYKTASFNRIARQAGIAKGSMYRYFENKKELYFFLIEYSTKRKIETINHLAISPTKNFFEMFEDMYEAGILFHQKEPLINLFLLRTAEENSAIEELGDLQKMYLEKAEAYFKPLIINAQEKHQIRDDLDSTHIAFMIIQNAKGMHEYMKLKYRTELDQSLKTGNWQADAMLSDIRKFVKDISKMLRQGLQKI